MTTSVLRRGRPRAFDRAEALRAAQGLIWRNGYEAMSLSQLEAAMGIGKTSLYAAFGSKFDLLREAADLYIAEAGGKIAGLLDEAHTAEAGLRTFFEMCAQDFTDPLRPYGCFLVSAAITGSDENIEARDYLREGRAAVGRLLSQRLQRALADRELLADTPVAALTEYLLTVLHGMSIQARDGRSFADLMGTVRLAMGVFAPFRQTRTA